VIRVLLLVLVAASAASASSSVKGTVVDPNGQSFSGAKVLLLNPVDQKVLYETVVVQGTFRIEPVAPQSYFINIKALAFREHADAVSVAQDQAVDMGRITISIGLLYTAS
jgi:P pilus assembly chaperone PapD